MLCHCHTDEVLQTKFFEIKLSCEELKQNKKPGIDPLIQHQAFFKIYFKKFYVTKMP